MARKAIVVEGLAELNAQMGRLFSATEPADLNRLFADALGLIRDEAARNLDSVTTRAERLQYPGQQHIADAFAIQEGKSPKYAIAWLKVWRRFAPQAIWIEYGHRIVGHKPGKKDTGGKVPAKPFFRPAIASQRAQVKARIEAGIKKFIERNVL